MILESGISVAAGDDDEFVLRSPSPIGEPRTESWTFDTPGQYGVSCTDLSGGENNGQGLSYVTMIDVTR